MRVRTWSRLGLAASIASFGVVAAVADVIDFESEAPRTILGQVFSADGLGPIGVEGFNPNCDPGVNAAVVFDSSMPSGGDIDLGSPNETCVGGGPGVGTAGELGMPNENCDAQGNLLIVHERCAELAGVTVRDPDDVDVVGSMLSFDFAAIGPVVIESMVLLDVEAVEPNALVELFDDMDVLIAMFNVDSTGDNGKVVVGLGPTPGVTRMKVTLNGSGSIDEIVFNLREPECGDGEVNAPGETCDPPGEPAGEPDECREDCTYCGDGIRDEGLEQCDDGNNEDGDGCSATCEVERGDDGCTPGYWKQPHHFFAWTTYSPGDSFDGVFGVDAPGDDTLLSALRDGGGHETAFQRHAVAALLNTANGDVDYAYSTAEVKAIVTDAYASGDFSAKGDLEAANEAGCPLGNGKAREMRMSRTEASSVIERARRVGIAARR